MRNLIFFDFPPLLSDLHLNHIFSERFGDHKPSILLIFQRLDLYELVVEVEFLFEGEDVLVIFNQGHYSLQEKDFLVWLRSERSFGLNVVWMLVEEVFHQIVVVEHKIYRTDQAESVRFSAKLEEQDSKQIPNQVSEIENKRLQLEFNNDVLEQGERKSVEYNIVFETPLFLVEHVEKTEIENELYFWKTLLNKHWRNH